MQKLFINILDELESGDGNGCLRKETADNLMSRHGLAEDDANCLASFFINSAVAQRAHRKMASISPEVEAVQIEWISNGILVRGKSADGAFCNYYCDTTQFISQAVNGRATQFVKNKAPKVGDTCILYFGMSESASE